MQTEKSKAWRFRRGQITHEQRAILDASKTPELSAEDDARFNALTEEDERLEKAINREERTAANEHDLAQPIEEPTKPEPRNDAGEPEARVSRTATPEYLRAYQRFLKTGDTRGVMTVEERATADGLQADADTAGGFTILPQQVASGLLQAVDDRVYIRQRATVETVASAASLGVVSLDADPEDGDWTQELTTVDFDTQMEFGKRELRPHELTKGIKVSRKLLNRSTMPIESIVNDRLAYKFALTMEKAFLTGTGANRPLGLFTASADGISTGQDVTAAATTSFTADNLIDTQMNVKAQYQSSGVWVMHRDTVARVRKLKDGNGQYLWQPGLQSGQPNTILGSEYLQSEHAPNTFTTGLYVALFGDLSFYRIADAEDISIQRLVELYAATNQIGFIARAASDGMPVLEEAFSRLILA